MLSTPRKLPTPVHAIDCAAPEKFRVICFQQLNVPVGSPPQPLGNPKSVWLARTVVPVAPPKTATEAGNQSDVYQKEMLVNPPATLIEAERFGWPKYMIVLGDGSFAKFPVPPASWSINAVAVGLNVTP